MLKLIVSSNNLVYGFMLLAFCENLRERLNSYHVIDMIYTKSDKFDTSNKLLMS